MAYAISRASKSTQSILLLVIILPFWTSFLLGSYALEGIIRDGGISHGPVHLGLISAPAEDHAHESRGVPGDHLTRTCPHGLPLFATLEKLDNTLLEAAADLGSPPWRAFWMSGAAVHPGVIAGLHAGFHSAVGEFVIPSLLGGPTT